MEVKWRQIAMVVTVSSSKLEDLAHLVTKQEIIRILPQVRNKVDQVAGVGLVNIT